MNASQPNLHVRADIPLASRRVCFFERQGDVLVPRVVGGAARRSAEAPPASPATRLLATAIASTIGGALLTLLALALLH